MELVKKLVIATLVTVAVGISFVGCGMKEKDAEATDAKTTEVTETVDATKEVEVPIEEVKSEAEAPKAEEAGNITGTETKTEEVAPAEEQKAE